MDKDRILGEIFNDDPLGLLIVTPKQSNARTPDERLLASFYEINEFIKKNGREPGPNVTDVSEFQLYSRLKSLKEDPTKVEMLKESDFYHLLPEFEMLHGRETSSGFNITRNELNTIDDILGDDSLDLLGGNDTNLFDFKHTPKQDMRESADFVARRKPCTDFENYEADFKNVQLDLANRKRKLVPFTETLLKEKNYYVHNGILLYLESVDYKERDWSRGENEQHRLRKYNDGRTRTIFENGTESNMLLRSLAKALISNGNAVTQNFEKINQGFLENFGNITDEDKESGYIYVLKSKSKDEKITSIRDLFKIGYATNIEERLKGAEKQSTYLMAPVDYISGWKCYNMNPQKLEQLIHNFFGNSCLEVDVFDANGKRHTPREWFIAPIEVIEQAIELIINGKITKYVYDAENKTIIQK